jgi:hypothetical protein
VHAVEPDPQFELDMAAHLKEQLTREQLLEAFGLVGKTWQFVRSSSRRYRAFQSFGCNLVGTRLP